MRARIFVRPFHPLHALALRLSLFFSHPFATATTTVTATAHASTSRAPPDERERGGPHDDEVEHQRHEYAEDRPEVVHDMMALVRKHDDDRVKEAKQRERREVRQEARLEECARGRSEHREAGHDACEERDAEVLPKRGISTQLETRHATRT